MYNGLKERNGIRIMKLIYGGNGTGKTKRILEMSRDTKTPIMCESEQRRLRLLEKAKGYGIDIPNPVVFSNALKGSKVLVDDPYRLLAAAFDVTLEGITVNVESDDVEKL